MGELVMLVGMVMVIWNGSWRGHGIWDRISWGGQSFISRV